MTTIFDTLRRLNRMPRHHRIAHLKALLANEKPRSVRASELSAALKREVTAQIRDESREDRIRRTSGAVTPAPENAA
jgi:hypothetical protein